MSRSAPAQVRSPAEPRFALGWYNGWSPEERLATVPIQKAAIACGELARPARCSICRIAGNRNWKADDAVWLHDENYADPLAAYAVCRRCHRTLHRRFDNPEPWLALVAKHARGGAWFERLTMDPASMRRPFEVTYPAGLPSA